MTDEFRHPFGYSIVVLVRNWRGGPVGRWARGVDWNDDLPDAASVLGALHAIEADVYAAVERHTEPPGVNAERAAVQDTP